MDNCIQNVEVEKVNYGLHISSVHFLWFQWK